MKTISELWPGIDSQGFRRNQIEWALWRVFHKLGQNAPQPPTLFTTRIKRLLDLDRRLELPKGANDPGFARYAYSDARPQGKGSDAEFLAVDGFCLAVGLDLLDVGLNQRDVIFFGRGVRRQLLVIFEKILKEPERDSRQAGNPKDYPGLPTYRHKRSKLADFSIYLVVRRVELKSTLPDHLRKALPAEIPVFFEPAICQGSEELGKFLADLRLKERKAIVVELGYSATGICRWLSQAPFVTRGQPKH